MSSTPNLPDSVSQELRSLRVVTITGWRLFLRLAAGVFFVYQILGALTLAGLLGGLSSGYSPYGSSGGFPSAWWGIAAALIAGLVWWVIDAEINLKFPKSAVATTPQISDDSAPVEQEQ